MELFKKHINGTEVLTYEKSRSQPESAYNSYFFFIPCGIITLLAILLLIIEIGLIVPTHRNNVDALKERGYFQNIQVESGETIWDTPKSWRNPFANLFKTCDCIYGKVSLSRESVKSMMSKYDWSEWVITEQEWDNGVTWFDEFEQEVVHPTMLEFDNLKAIYVGKNFLISERFERECMNSTFFSPCHCYLDTSNCTLYYYIYHD